MKRSGFQQKIKPEPGILRTASLHTPKPSLATRPRSRKCRVCKQPYVVIRSLQVVCGQLCAQKQAQVKREKMERQQLKLERAADKQKKESLKTRSDWMKETQIEFNTFIRTRDRIAGYSCISSGRPLDWSGNGVDAGHYRSVGSAPHLRFDERNCHAQSKQDNRYGAGRAVDYRIGLIARIGKEAVEALECDQASRDHSIDALKAIKALYRAKTKELLAGDK